MSLHELCASCDFEGVKKLLTPDKDVNVVDREGFTMLHIVASRMVSDSTELAKFVISKGINVNFKDETKDGVTALHIACVHHATAMVEILLENEADVNSASNNGQTALHVVCSKGFDDILHMLLNHGADLNIKTVDKNTALHLASFANSAACCELLVNSGININDQNRFGSTALHWACKADSTAAAQFLLKQNADHTLLNKNMQTAFALGKIGPLLEKIHQLENEKDQRKKAIEENLEKSTEEELDALQSFLKSAGFSKTKSSLYASCMLFVHAIRSVSQLQELSTSGSLEPLLNLMLVGEIDKVAIINQLQKLQKMGSTNIEATKIKDE